MVEISIILLLGFFILVVFAVPVVFLLKIFGWSTTGVPYVPVPEEVFVKIPEALQISDNSVVYDLGCGDGRVLYKLAEHSSARFIGVESAPLPLLLATVRGLFSKRKNVKILAKDFFKMPITDATHVYIYLLTPIMEKILPKFKAELKPGTKVVSCDFQFEGVTPTRTIEGNSWLFKHTLYVYEF